MAMSEELNGLIDITIAESDSADFEQGTWTFSPVSTFKVSAGLYALVRADQLEVVIDHYILLLREKAGC
jgi:hypothetical protein